jgi:integral membrane protein
MKSRQEIKKQARELIAKDNLWFAVGLPTLVLTLVNLVFAFNETTGVSSAIAGLAMLVNLCSSLYVFDILRKQRIVREDLGSKVSDMFGSLTAHSFKAGLLSGFIVGLWFFIPYVLGLGILIASLIAGYFGVILLLGIALAVFGLVFGVIKSCDYALVIYLAKVNENLGLFALLKESKQRMKGHRWALFVQNLSFFWWVLGVFATGGLLGLYVTPYVVTATTIFATGVLGIDTSDKAEKDLEVF